MSRQIEWVAALQARVDGRLWLDSGTLLGMMRDGSVLAHDKDVDMGMWADDLPAVEPVLRALQGADHRVLYKRYRGIVYHVSIHSVTSAWLPMNINVYRRQGAHAWCAQGHMKSEASPFVKRVVTLFFRLVWGDRYASRFWPMSAAYAVYTWWIPARFFDSIDCTDVSGVSLYVPAAWSEYLGCRYGVWETPVRDWSYWKHDQCILLERPEHVIQQSEDRGNS